MKKIINITHYDTDGVGCGVLCNHFASRCGMEAEVHHCGYGNIASTIMNVLARLDDHDEDIRLIIISDISFRESDTKVLNAIIKATEEHDTVIRLLDHHATANWLNEYDWAEVNECDCNGVKHCGTWWVYHLLLEILSQEYLTLQDEIDYPTFCLTGFESNPDVKYPRIDTNQLMEYVKVVDLYDTWRWVDDYPDDSSYELAVDLDRLLKTKGIEEFSQDMLEILNSDPKYTLIHGCVTSLLSDLDCSLIRYKSKEIQRVIDQKGSQMLVGDMEFKVPTGRLYDQITNYIFTKFSFEPAIARHLTEKYKPGYIKHFNVGLVYCDDYASEIGNALAKKHPELDFIILVGLPTSISYRCCKDLPIPLGVIANVIGKGIGGGHDKSAGTPLKFRKTKKLSENLIGGLSL